jgi:hypothetical protein
MLDATASGGPAVAHLVRSITSLVARRARRVDRVLRQTATRRGRWRWAIPLGGFGLCALVLVVAGIMSGVSALEYIPIALFEALVIGGLFVVCMSPVTEPPDSDDGGRGPDDDPTSAPPPFDPSLWVTILDPPDKTPESGPSTHGAPHREPVGGRR